MRKGGGRQKHLVKLTMKIVKSDMVDKIVYFV